MVPPVGVFVRSKAQHLVSCRGSTVLKRDKNVGIDAVEYHQLSVEVVRRQGRKVIECVPFCVTSDDIPLLKLHVGSPRTDDGFCLV